jgi:transcriptional regulator with XRE-family HTH domain
VETSQKDEVLNLLDVLGWSRADLATKVNVHPNTVQNWMRSGRFGPGVIPYLRLLAAIRGLQE